MRKLKRNIRTVNKWIWLHEHKQELFEYAAKLQIEWQEVSLPDFRNYLDLVDKSLDEIPAKTKLVEKTVNGLKEKIKKEEEKIPAETTLKEKALNTHKQKIKEEEKAVAEDWQEQEADLEEIPDAPSPITPDELEEVKQVAIRVVRVTFTLKLGEQITDNALRQALCRYFRQDTMDTTITILEEKMEPFTT